MKTNILEFFENPRIDYDRGKAALIFGTDKTTFDQLDRLSDALACHLARSIGARKGPIAVLLDRSPEVVVADIAILKSGNFYTNLDTRAPSLRFAQLISNISPIAIVTNDSNLQMLNTLNIDSSLILNLSKIDLEQTDLGAELLQDIRARHIDTDPMCLINTSGSTGVPKSVVLNHRSTIDFIEWLFRTFEFTSNDQIGSLSPFYFDIYTLELLTALATGATLHVIPEKAATFPATLVDYLSDRGVTFIFWVPTMMVNIANLGLLESGRLSKLRRVFFAGEVLPTRHLNIWRRHLPNTEFVNLYGPIEITVDCTYYVIDRDFSDDEPLPIGKPCSNSDVFLLSEEDQLITTMRTTGEICVRGSSLALGYFNNAEQTARSFVQNPLNSAYPETIYRTGDLGFWNEDGEMMFVGRKDFQIKHQGYRIELPEIENAALQIEGIKNACVVYARERQQIVLIYEAVQEIKPSQIRASLLSRLPKYMLPKLIIHTSTMPMNPNGKIDRQHLQRLHAD